MRGLVRYSLADLEGASFRPEAIQGMVPALFWTAFGSCGWMHNVLALPCYFGVCYPAVGVFLSFDWNAQLPDGGGSQEGLPRSDGSDGSHGCFAAVFGYYGSGGFGVRQQYQELLSVAVIVDIC